MGSLAVVLLLAFCTGKLLRGIHSLVQSTCGALERWYHLDDRPYAPIIERSSTQAGLHTRHDIRRLARELRQMTELQAYTFDPDPVACCLFVGPPDAGQKDVARAMASAVGASLLTINLHVTNDAESCGRLLRTHSSWQCPSSTRVVFFEHLREATPEIREALKTLLQTGTLPDQTGGEVALHGSLIIVSLTMASDFMEHLYALPEGELRDALTQHPTCAGREVQQLIARATLVLPLCPPSREAIHALVAERLAIALRFMGQARLQVDEAVVEAFTHEVEAAGYPLIDIDDLAYDHLARAIRAARAQRPWFAALRRKRLVVVEESPAETVSAVIR